MINKFVIYNKNEPQMEIVIDNMDIRCKQLVDKLPIEIPLYIRPKNLTLRNFNQWVESRVPSRFRPDINKILKHYNLPSWNPMWMLAKDHGVSMNDFVWVRINDEDVCFDDIRLR